MNPLTLNPLQIKFALVGICLGIAAMGSLTIWALLERNGRLECKVELVQARDQVQVLAASLAEQNKAIQELGQATARGRLELRQIVERIDKGHASTRQAVQDLEKKIKDPTPRRADGSLKDCRDALKEWRDERRSKGGAQ